MNKQPHTPDTMIDAMRAAENFPKNTCPASRHTALIAEALIRGETHHALTDEPDNCGDSMAATVAALWEARSIKAELLAALKGVVRVADRATVEFDAARAAIARAEGEV